MAYPFTALVEQPLPVVERARRVESHPPADIIAVRPLTRAFADRSLSERSESRRSYWYACRSVAYPFPALVEQPLPVVERAQRVETLSRIGMER